MCKLKTLFLLRVIVTGISLFISCSVMARSLISLHPYGFNGSYKLINASINTLDLGSLQASFEKPKSNFFNSFIHVLYDNHAMEYHFELPNNATHAMATLYFVGILFPGTSHISTGVYCTANVSISNKMLTLNNPVCHADKYHFTMTFNGKSTAVFSLKANSFPQLDISYIAL